MLKILQISVTAYAQNCRLIYNDETNEGCVVDPGGKAQIIADYAKEHNICIKSILLTHGHLDHIGGVSELIKLTCANVYGPCIEDKSLIDNIKEQSSLLGLNDAESFEFESIYDGQKIKVFDDFEIEVLKTPGHTPGGVCYLCRKYNFILTGDTLFKGSIGRTDFPGGDYNALMDSIQNKLLNLDDEITVLSGHGESSTIGFERLHNPFFN
mgnify:CR=1 FL=1